MPRFPWHETLNLVTSETGIAYIKTFITDQCEQHWSDWKRLGYIERAADRIPPAMDDEFQEHLDLWRDTQRTDYEVI